MLHAQELRSAVGGPTIKLEGRLEGEALTMLLLTVDEQHRGRWSPLELDLASLDHISWDGLALLRSLQAMGVKFVFGEQVPTRLLRAEIRSRAAA